ncbi:hypothetical protein C5S30_00955 [ANME-1 cluster archaeon GoMg4]|nr:hypothetical protein [ANME-1 cluster archaeon GoMg4]
MREALELKNETIPDQRKKPTKKPRMRRVFQVFEGITILYSGSEIVQVLNLRPIHGRILALLGREYERMYFAPAMDNVLRRNVAGSKNAMQSWRRKVSSSHLLFRAKSRQDKRRNKTKGVRCHLCIRN